MIALFNSKKKVFLTSLVHGVFLTLLTFGVINAEYVHWDDGELVWANNMLKKVIFKVDEKVDPSEFIFINVCYDNMLIEKNDKNGFLLGNQDITDRVKLAKFYKAINENPTHKLILTDIRFEDVSKVDSILNREIIKVPRLLCSYHQSPGKKVSYDRPIFDVPLGLSDYSNDGDFLKFKFIRNDSVKTTPLEIFESITKTKVSFKHGLLNYDDGYFLNNCILDLRIRNYHIKQNNSVGDSSEFHAKYVQLGDLLVMADILGNSYVQNEVKDRIVVLGDFEDRDIHNSTVGNIPGPIILINGYLALKNKDNEITVGLIAYLTICYSLLSYFLFTSGSYNLENIFASIPWLSRFKFILEFLGYFVFLFCLAFSCYMFFGIQYSVILITMYVKLVDWILDNYVRDKA